MGKETPVLECRNLCVSYYTRAGEIPAVVDFNLTLMPGEASSGNRAAANRPSHSPS